MAADTIFALSSGSVPSGLAVIRISGAGVSKAISAVCRTRLQPRLAQLLTFFHPETGERLDEGLALYFEGPASFTGEDVLELHGHGGVASVSALLDALGTLPGFRPAEAGEFSRRAFENGRLDLTEVEGLSDLIGAQTEEQRKLALRQAGGELRKLYGGWRYELIRLRAMIEAALDFADEDDVPAQVDPGVWPRIAELHGAIQNHLDDGHNGEIARRGFRVALLGPPNAGKSSLLNALARKDVAIVTPLAGTTRDVIEVSLDISGHLVVVSDTAGIRDAEDIVEQEGIRRANQAAQDADLVLWLWPCDEELTVGGSSTIGNVDYLVVRTKGDLVAELPPGIVIDTLHADGIAPLVGELTERLSSLRSGGEEPLLTRARHRTALEICVENLAEAERPLNTELRSEHLRLAADALGGVTGRIDVEDLLDVIFSEFCVGK